jgi:hypothetical protein
MVKFALLRVTLALIVSEQFMLTRTQELVIIVFMLMFLTTLGLLRVQMPIDIKQHMLKLKPHTEESREAHSDLT